MRIAALRSLIVALCLPIVAFAQNAQQPPASVAEALAVCQKVVDEEKAKLAVAQAEHDAAVAEAEKQLIANLKVLAKEAVAGGDDVEAARRWEAVLERDPQEPDAVAFFEFHKRKDLLKKYAGKVAQAIQRVEFRTKGGRIYRRESNGLWSDSHSQWGPHREIIRTSYAVVLERVNDKSWIWLLPDQMLYGRPEDRKHWAFDELGEWVK